MELCMNGRAIETVRAGGRHGALYWRVPAAGSGWPTPRRVSDRPSRAVAPGTFFRKG